ncbi:MAG: TrkA C-terminal domain-containing protein [Selenomonadaceae bacterium]
MQSKEITVSIPKYQQIAIEIAAKIVHEDYQIGQKIYGRSAIAGQYNVSPETARRAFCILSDMGIIRAEKGNGMIIISQKKAVEFLQSSSGRKTIENIKVTIRQHIEQQQNEMNSLNKCLSELISATEHFQSMNPLMPFSLRITSQCRYLNKTIQEIQLWQHTGATLVAIWRQEQLLRSPGPYAILQENDVIYFVSQEDCDQQVHAFLF